MIVVSTRLFETCGIETGVVPLSVRATPRHGRPLRCTPFPQDTHKRVIGPGCLDPLLVGCNRKVAKGCEGRRTVLYPGVRVPRKSQIDVGMTGKVLSLFRMYTRTGQVGDERVAEGMEVQDPARFIAV